ncbi:MAG TPA: CPBP family intramembrane glutamic endopeptidase [Terracidiphilus sp.]|jgi:hypothetical protein
MSTWPDSAADPDESHVPASDAMDPLPPAEDADGAPSGPAAPVDSSFLQTYVQLVAPPRFPNIFDAALMGLLLAFAWLASGGLAATALHYRLFGVATQAQAANDLRFTLGGQVIWYLIALGLWRVFFPLVWHESFFSGIEWRVGAAFRLRWQLFGTASACFVLAIIDAIVLPGPKEAPIDQVFRMPGGAWVLFLFGVTLAPVMEEFIFRGFLLPALCIAWDWSAERLLDRPAPSPDEEGKTRWSKPAMIFGAIVTSVPFALMHGQQTSYAAGTFVLLVSVSLGLSWVRLRTRSVAASTVVHACYNFLLFAFMLLGTGGFKHMDKL